MHEVNASTFGGADDDSQQSTTAYSAVWSGFGGNSGATNEVTGDLPIWSFDISSGASESGYLVYASPVILQTLIQLSMLLLFGRMIRNLSW